MTSRRSQIFRNISRSWKTRLCPKLFSQPGKFYVLFIFHYFFFLFCNILYIILSMHSESHFNSTSRQFHIDSYSSNLKVVQIWITESMYGFYYEINMQYFTASTAIQWFDWPHISLISLHPFFSTFFSLYSCHIQGTPCQTSCSLHKPDLNTIIVNHHTHFSSTN